MGARASFVMPYGDVGNEALLQAANEGLAARGLVLSANDMRMLANRRAQSLLNAERVEFGMPALVRIVEEIATSPYLAQATLAMDLATLQDAFYAVRTEMPAQVPDSEIAQGLRGCFDAWHGDAAEVASLAPEEVMAFSAEYQRVIDAQRSEAYRIADDQGRVYVFDPAEWDYDEWADGWDGEKWGDNLD
ncbi:MAG: DUF6323 family protein [Coriobacteriales bacterium]|nr:DUF6323 family protein [Coriobacteriales bacterium]